MNTCILLQLILYPIHISRKHIVILGKLQKSQESKSVPRICSLGQPENQRFRMKLLEYLTLSYGFSASRYTNIYSVITYKRILFPDQIFRQFEDPSLPDNYAVVTGKYLLIVLYLPVHTE
jgi:hypothetical protein